MPIDKPNIMRTILTAIILVSTLSLNAQSFDTTQVTKQSKEDFQMHLLKETHRGRDFFRITTGIFMFMTPVAFVVGMQFERDRKQYFWKR